MPYKGGVQLLPESERRPTLRSYTSGNTYFYTAIVIGIFILVASATLATYKKSLNDQIDQVRAEIVAGDAARNLTEEKALITASKQSRTMKQLLEHKLYWSQAFQRLEQMTQSSVKFVNFNAKVQKGSIEFKAAADSYATVAKQLAAFAAGAGVKDFTIGKIETTSKDTVEFTGEIFIDTKAMLLRITPSPSPRPIPTP